MTAAVRAALAGLAVLAAAGAAYLIAATPPTPDSLYPKCVSHRLTGLHCPGCGTGRAMHAALNGRLTQALAYNPFAVVLLPPLAGCGLASLARWVTNRPRRREVRVGGRWVLALAVALAVFAVLRNVPAYPLTLLAPHELEGG